MRWAVSAATDAQTLQADLVRALQLQRDADPEVTETTRPGHPLVLQEFLGFNDFWCVSDDAVAVLATEGGLQVTGCHAEFRCAEGGGSVSGCGRHLWEPHGNAAQSSAPKAADACGCEYHGTQDRVCATASMPACSTCWRVRRRSSSGPPVWLQHLQHRYAPLGLCGQQLAQRDRHRQHPLPHRHMGDGVVDRLRRGLQHLRTSDWATPP